MGEAREELRSDALYGESGDNAITGTEISACEQIVCRFLRGGDDFSSLFEYRHVLPHISRSWMISLIEHGYMTVLGQLLTQNTLMGLELVASTIFPGSFFNEVYACANVVPTLIEQLGSDSIPYDQVLLISKCITNACKACAELCAQISQTAVLTSLIDKLASSSDDGVDISRAIQAVMRHCDLDLTPLETVFVPMMKVPMAPLKARCLFYLMQTLLKQMDTIYSFDNDEFAELIVHWLRNCEDKTPVLMCISSLTKGNPVTVADRLVERGLLQALVEIESVETGSYVIVIASNVASISSDNCQHVIDAGFADLIVKYLDGGSYQECRLTVGLVVNIMRRGEYRSITPLLTPLVIESMLGFLDEEVLKESHWRILDGLGEALMKERQVGESLLHTTLCKDDWISIIHDFSNGEDRKISIVASRILGEFA